MKVAVKLDLEVSREIGDQIEGQSRIVNWLYNHLLETANQEKEKFKATQDPESAKLVYSERGLRNLVPELKKTYPFLKCCHCAPLKNAAMRLTRSIQAFQKDRKKPKNQQLGRGWPQFRSTKKKFFSLEMDEYGNGYQLEKKQGQWWVLLSFGKNKEGQKLSVRIPIRDLPAWLEQSILKAQFAFAQAKTIRIQQKKENKNNSKEQTSDAAPEKKPHLRRFLPFTGLRIHRIGKTWTAILSVEKEVKSQIPEFKSIAVMDPNHKNLAYLVDSLGEGVEIQNLSFVKTLDKRIDQIQKRRDRCCRKSVRIDREDQSSFYKPSRRWRFFQDKLDELRRVRREKMKSALYCISNKLVDQYDFIAMGDYAPRGGGITTGMRRSMNNQSQIGSFKTILKWVCLREGKHYFEWNERDSTKTCSSCACKTELTRDPSVRSWQCLNCHRHHLRDENAALNGFKEVAKEFTKTNMSGSGHVLNVLKDPKVHRVMNRWAWKFSGSGISVSRAVKYVES